MVAKCRHRDHCGTVWHHPQNRNYMRNHNAARGTTAVGNIWWQFYHHGGQQLQIWWSSHMWLQRYVSIQTHGLAYHYTFAPLTGQNCSSCCVVLCAVSLSAHSGVLYCSTLLHVCTTVCCVQGWCHASSERRLSFPWQSDCKQGGWQLSYHCWQVCRHSYAFLLVTCTDVVFTAVISAAVAVLQTALWWVLVSINQVSRH